MGTPTTLPDRWDSAPAPAVLAELDHACFDAAWSKEHYASLLSNPAVRAWVLAGVAGTPAGLLCFVVAGGEAEVYRIGVHPSQRRQGLGACLLDALLDTARRQAWDAVLLEVRAGNGPARALYRRAAMREAGRRSGYYTDPRDDAVLYRWEPESGAAGSQR